MRDNLTELIFSAGVVGCGGAGFPTHKKVCGQVEDFIVNGVECEPLLRTDRYIMAHYAGSWWRPWPPSERSSRPSGAPSA